MLMIEETLSNTATVNWVKLSLTEMKIQDNSHRLRESLRLRKMMPLILARQRWNSSSRGLDKFL
jgi:hypothetical protein